MIVEVYRKKKLHHGSVYLVIWFLVWWAFGIREDRRE